MPRTNPTTRRRKRRKRWFHPRDLIFFAFALATYVQQFFMGDGEPSLLGLFAVFFFIGLVPALKADGEGLSVGDVQRLLIKLLGGEPPSGGGEDDV